MATEIFSNIGSGNQQHRQDNVNKHHKGALAVNVVNYEDMSLVHGIRSSGYDIVINATKLPSGVANLANRREIRLVNTTNNPVYIGQSGVTAANGYPLTSGLGELRLQVAGNVDVYAVAGVGTSNIRIIELS